MLPDFPEIFVLRHGQTEWNATGRHQGRLDSPLTDLGCAQASTQSRLLASALGARTDFTAYCSPQGRASDTADIVFAPLALSVRADARLCEVSFGKWQGLTFEQIAQGWPELAEVADLDPFGWHFQAPGGEAFKDISARVREFLQDLIGPSIIVTHGITSRILRGLWLGLGMDGMAQLPGGQGCVHHLLDAGHQTLHEPKRRPSDNHPGAA
jgi:probable phosphoglycerate mutase